MAKPAAKSIAPKQTGVVALLSGVSLKIIPGIIVGFMFHEQIERAVDYILYHNVPVSETSYRDSRGADTKIYTNEKGERQLYIVAEGENQQKVAIDTDLLPVQKQLEERILQRYKKMTPEQAEKVVPFVDAQKKIIYGKLEK
jgi:IMP dehydrogenase/GMP reductase